MLLHFSRITTRTACIALILAVSALLCLAQHLPTEASFISSCPGASSAVPAEIREIETDLQAARFREALAKAQEVVKRQPDNALAWTYLGMASVRLNQADQAVHAFERAIAICPVDPRPFFDVALIYASNNELDKAIDRFQ